MTNSSGSSTSSLVSVIIPTRDRSEVLRKCLACVFAQEYEHFEVIVVDNSVRQADTQRVVQQFPGIRYIREDPARANPAHMRNVGIAASRGEILAFIDDDSLVFPGWMEALAVALSDPTVGGVSGRVIEASAPLVDTPEIGKFYSSGVITANFNNLIDRPVELDYLNGCNHAVSRGALRCSGLYDPWLPTYEDPELGFRIRKSGYRLLYVPGMLVEHMLAPRSGPWLRRSGYFDLRSHFLSCRSLTYLCMSHFGLNRGFAKTAFVDLPKSLTASFVRTPSLGALSKIVAAMVGVAVGLCMTAARRWGLHSPPELQSSS